MWKIVTAITLYLQLLASPLVSAESIDLLTEEALSNACNNENFENCTNIAFVHLKTHFKPKNAIAALQKTCKTPYPRACFELAKLHIDGNINFLKKDMPEANKLLTISCDTTDISLIKSCFYLGTHYEDGIGVQKNINHAIAFFQKACDQNHLESCTHLAMIYLKSQNTKGNSPLKKESEKLLSYACKNRYDIACELLVKHKMP